MYTEEIEKVVCNILYSVKQINQQQNKLDDCHFVYIHLKPITLYEALLAF